MERKEHKDLEQDKDLEQTTDILCDVCMESTQLNYAVLSANWGSGSKHMENSMNCIYVRHVSSLLSQR
jgi:hypothetical protein